MDPQSDLSNAPVADAQAGGEGVPPATQEASPQAPTPVTSIRDAFEVASAAASATQDAGEGDARKASPDGTPAAPKADATPAPSAKAAERPTPSLQAALRRYDSLKQQNRLGELSPEDQGELRKFREGTIREHQAEQDREAQFKGLYLDLMALEHENPAQYAADIKAEPNKLAFQLAYAKAHPDVTLEAPDPTPKALTREQHYEARDQEWSTAVEETVQAIASQAGLKSDELAGLRQGAKGPLTFLTAVFEEGVKREAEKARASIRKEEHDAAAKEFSAREVGKVTTPRYVPGRPAAIAVQGSQTPRNIREAFAIAEKEAADA